MLRPEQDLGGAVPDCYDAWREGPRAVDAGHAEVGLEVVVSIGFLCVFGKDKARYEPSLSTPFAVRSMFCIFTSLAIRSAIAPLNLG